MYTANLDRLKGVYRMRQLLVECSDPGLVVSLAEELEHVLRHMDFARAQTLGSQLGPLASGLGPEFEQAWRDFRLEVPGMAAIHRPLATGSRLDLAETCGERFLRVNLDGTRDCCCFPTCEYRVEVKNPGTERRDSL